MAAPKRGKRAAPKKSTRQKPKVQKSPGGELNKPAPFVPAVDPELVRGVGRPSKYDPSFAGIAQAMAAAGAPEYVIAAHLEISPTTMWSWKAEHPEFLKALALGKEVIDHALRATMIQRALGYSYETQKAFQTGVVVTITETLPPSESMLKFLGMNRMPAEFSDEKKITLTGDEVYQRALERMNQIVQQRLLAPPRKIINVEAVEVTA